MVAGTAMMLSPSSREGAEVGGSGVTRSRKDSTAERKGVPKGLESFDGVQEGGREVGVVVYEDA